MSDSTSRLLDMYNQTIQCSLTEDSPLANQPPEIKLPLKRHQLSMVAAMKQKELDCLRGFTINNELHHSQFAVLGDKVGAGKTLMVLAHIAAMKAEAMPMYHRINGSSKMAFWSTKPIHTAECSGNTLIIVPHTLFHQWKQAIANQTTLSFLEVKNVKTLDAPNFLTLVKERDITLMTNTTLRHYMAANPRNTMLWKRIVFDELDTIQIPATIEKPLANFYWLVTASWANYLFHGLYSYLTQDYLARNGHLYHPEVLQVLTHEGVLTNFYQRYDIKSANFFAPFISKHCHRGHLVLRNMYTYLQQSWESPPITTRQILCETPASYRIIANFVSPEIQELLNAGDTQGALERLGVVGTTQSSLINAVCETREKDLDRLKKTLVYKESIEYATPAAKEAALAHLREKIGSLETQIRNLKERITNSAHEICAICFEEPKVPTFVMCCSRIFCGQCVVNWMQRSSSCALCRGPLTTQSLRKLTEADGPATNVVVVPRKPTKKEALLQILKENPRSRILVFNRYDNPFVELESQLQELGFKVASVRGNRDVVSRTLANFEEGKTQILLMNSTQAGVGMDLKSATHVILMHTMRREEEKQILGRALRLGRTEPLTFIKLLFEEETTRTTF